MLKKSLVAAAAAMISLSACGEGTSASITGTTPITGQFQAGTTLWNKTAAVTAIYFMARERDGQVEVCGAVTTDGPGLYRSGEPKVLQANFLRIGDTTIANSIHYFNRLPPIDLTENFGYADAIGQDARCATTGAPWRTEFEGAPIEMVLRARSASL